MTLNQKAIDAINKAKELVALYRKVDAEHSRAFAASREATDLCYYDPEVRSIALKLAKITHDLRQVQQTILIHLGAERD
jgi:fumarate hydratase class II